VSEVSGTIDISLAFTDTTSRETKTVLKTISLGENKAVAGTAAKIAIISGTVAGTAVLIDLAPTVYRNASGNFVSFSDVTRVALLSENANPVELTDNDIGAFKLVSYEGVVSSSRWGGGDVSAGLNVRAINSGTADYTIVITKE
jgi:hypothetical protein